MMFYETQMAFICGAILCAVGIQLWKRRGILAFFYASIFVASIGLMFAGNWMTFFALLAIVILGVARIFILWDSNTIANLILAICVCIITCLSGARAIRIGDTLPLFVCIFCTVISFMRKGEESLLRLWIVFTYLCVTLISSVVYFKFGLVIISITSVSAIVAILRYNVMPRVQRKDKDLPREFFATSDLLRAKKGKRFAKVVADAYAITDWFCEDNPDYRETYYLEYISGIFRGKHEIVACYIGGKIAAVAILKKNVLDREISVFCKKSVCSEQDITELFEKCFAWLGTTKPIARIEARDFSQLDGLIEKYGWIKTQIHRTDDKDRRYVFNEDI